MAHSLVDWAQEVVNRGMMGEHGRIFAMTSSGSNRVIPTYGPVSAAKASLEAHCRQLAWELAPGRSRSTRSAAGSPTRRHSGRSRARLPPGRRQGEEPLGAPHHAGRRGRRRRGPFLPPGPLDHRQRDQRGRGRRDHRLTSITPGPTRPRSPRPRRSGRGSATAGATAPPPDLRRPPGARSPPAERLLRHPHACCRGGPAPSSTTPRNAPRRARPERRDVPVSAETSPSRSRSPSLRPWPQPLILEHVEKGQRRGAGQRMPQKRRGVERLARGGRPGFHDPAAPQAGAQREPPPSAFPTQSRSGHHLALRPTSQSGRRSGRSARTR
jgi:hypothetical protein